jgi:hypothetical protein
MKRVPVIACIFLLAGVPLGFAQTLTVDWKFYGTSTVDGDGHACFYEARSVDQAPDGHLRVWTKCLLLQSLDGIDVAKDFDGKVMEKAARKLVDGYVPPIATAETIRRDQLITITQYEETANIASFQPRSRIFYELNCSEKMLRELSIYFEADGRTGSIDKPTAWKHVSPETNGARLSKLLCAR